MEGHRGDAVGTTRHIAGRKADDAGRQSTRKERQLTVVSIDGTNARTMVVPVEMQGATGQSTADWSPDGRSLILGGGDDRGPGLFRISVDGEAPVRLVVGQATNPVRSPDGSLILFTGAFVGGRAPLQAMRPDGTPVPLPAMTVARVATDSCLTAQAWCICRGFSRAISGCSTSRQGTNASSRASRIADGWKRSTSLRTAEKLCSTACRTTQTSC